MSPYVQYPRQVLSSRKSRSRADCKTSPIRKQDPRQDPYPPANRHENRRHVIYGHRGGRYCSFLQRSERFTGTLPLVGVISCRPPTSSVWSSVPQGSGVTTLSPLSAPPVPLHRTGHPRWTPSFRGARPPRVHARTFHCPQSYRVTPPSTTSRSLRVSRPQEPLVRTLLYPSPVDL